MDVELYVYDLSKGLARQFSLPLTGVQIDAIYHTSLVFGGVEYFFGRGIHRQQPGATHHGKPMQIMKMGQTSLPMDVIEEYLESLEPVYSEESYDLFLHNCNNFTQDLSMFLVGKAIPKHISSLPERFLKSPFGQMMKPQIDAALRGFTQAAEVDDIPSQPRNGFNPRRLSISNGESSKSAKGIKSAATRVVQNVTTLRELNRLLAQASKSCAVIFFTSATCPPCKTVYPAYDDLAEETAGKATLIKVDTRDGFEIARKYSIRATPTFISFLHGEKEREWLGANEGQLRQNVRFLVTMAFPPHPHTNLDVPSFHGPVAKPVTYRKIPPLDKLVNKIGSLGENPVLTSLVSFVRSNSTPGSGPSPLPDLATFSSFIATNFDSIPPGNRFALIDLVRLALSDSRVSSFFVEEKDHRTLLTLLFPARDPETLSYNLRVVILQLCCNLFASPLFISQFRSYPALKELAMNLATHCLTDTHNNVRVLSASWIYNLAATNHNERIEQKADILPESDQIELVAALVEGIRNEEANVEVLHAELFALGMLVYMAPKDGEVWELCGVLDVKDVVAEKKNVDVLRKEPFLKEVGEELLGKGLSS